MIAAGGTRASGITTHSYDDAGTEQWARDHGYTVYCVAADTDGNIYTGGDSIYADSNNTTRKYDSDGNLQWSASHGGGAAVYGIAVDGAGNVYTAGTRTSSVTTRKYNSSGSLQWSRDYHGTLINCIAVDNAGNVYVAGADYGGYTTRKYDSSGSLQWSVNHGATVNCIAVDGAGNVYTGGTPYVYTTRKYDSDGNLQWSVNHGAAVYGIAVDNAGNVYTTGAISSSNTTRKYNSSGSLQWSVNFDALTTAIAIDASANLYVVGYLASDDAALRKYNASGDLQWSKTAGDKLRGVAYAAAKLSTTLPPLATPLALAIPTCTGFITIPALSIPLALTAPSVSSPPQPPELAGMPVARVYRAWLSGEGSDLLEVPIASFQSVRRAGESTWLALTVPTYSAALAAALTARMGGELVIDAGYRLADGSEQLGLFLRATLTEYAYELAARDGGSITLTARVTPTAHNHQTRALTGILSQSVNNGRHTVVCEVDPLLRPGDEVIAAQGVTLIVGAIRYSIGPQGAVMELTEAA